MHNWFREGFYGGLTIALVIGLYLTWLWQPERQVKRHTENLLHKIEQKSWASPADFIGSDYTAMVFVKERVNSLAMPFELEWHRTSGKPWDWKLIGVRNPGLEIPAGFEQKSESGGTRSVMSQISGR